MATWQMQCLLRSGASKQNSTHASGVGFHWIDSYLSAWFTLLSIRWVIEAWPSRGTRPIESTVTIAFTKEVSFCQINQYENQMLHGRPPSVPIKIRSIKQNRDFLYMLKLPLLHRSRQKRWILENIGLAEALSEWTKLLSHFLKLLL